MILLSLTVRNHKSIRDEVTFDLVRPSLRTLQPKDGRWSDAVYPLAGIFGGNATGKSTILDALSYAISAIRNSASTWLGRSEMVRMPFRLDGTEESSTSFYELDFVCDKKRYLYGFEVDMKGIKREWLKDIPTSRWRVLIDRDRDRDNNPLKKHHSLHSIPQATERELLLSRAFVAKHEQLYPVAQGMVNKFEVFFAKDLARAFRLRHIAESLAEGTVAFSDLEALLRAADIGITKVGVREEKISARLRVQFLRHQKKAKPSGAESDEQAAGSDAALRGEGIEKIGDEDFTRMIRHLTFKHHGAMEFCPEFGVQDESDGTLAWLAIAVPALEALRSGGVLVVDEIDDSLHPHLLDLLLGLFADPLLNKQNAQLIFTSHDAYILSPLSNTGLESEQVWFTDKARDGATELKCLADFPKHPDANVAKRYLTGRYGGTPFLSPGRFTSLLDLDDDVSPEGGSNNVAAQ